MQIAEFFIEKSVDIHAKDMYDRTALHPSCNRGHLQIAQMLIEHGAQVQETSSGTQTLEITFLLQILAKFTIKISKCCSFHAKIFKISLDLAIHLRS